MADDNKTFQQRYLEAKAEAQKYEVASGVYKQRLQEKLAGLIEALDTAVNELEKAGNAALG